MSFFGFEENNLEEERQRIRNGGAPENEDVAVYTWGEESYDGLGDALQEGGDDLNDETFGGGVVGAQSRSPARLFSNFFPGKDFDFAGQASLLEPELVQQKVFSSSAQPRLDNAPPPSAEQRA